MAQTRFLVGDCRTTLLSLPPESVQCVVTSPPYFGLRDYGHGDQIGLEETPSRYVAEMVAVFREVRRVLRDDGTLWLNIGDSYASGGSGGQSVKSTLAGNGHGRGKPLSPKLQALTAKPRATRRPAEGMKAKDLIGIPWMLAFALRADGWYLRSDIIWHKPNPMPENVRDRPTTAHEHIFLLTKSGRYFYDADAIAEPVTGNAHRRGSGVNPKAAANSFGAKQNSSFSAAVTELVEQRNARNVWTIASRAYAGAHFATMPPALAERCILAGTRPGDTVLDPFGGAGTTALAAERAGRNAILCELNAAYVAMAGTRLAA